METNKLYQYILAYMIKIIIVIIIIITTSPTLAYVRAENWKPSV